MASFRETIKSICPPWLLGPVGEGIGYACGIVMDALAESMRLGVKASTPDGALEDSVRYIGSETQIDRGPNETADDYAERLKTFRQDYKTAGSSARMLQQLRHYFSPTFGAEISTVSDRAVWHTINMGSGVVTKHVVSPTNWQWDPYAAGVAAAGTQRWWRTWLVLDSTPWSRDYWDTFTEWDDGGTWDSDATIEEVAAFMRLVDKWRADGIHIPFVVISFTPGLFAWGNAPGAPMPVGTMDDETVRDALDAMFWKGSPR